MNTKRIAIVGSGGVVGSALAEHLNHLGHNVVGIDLDTEATLENSLKDVSVVFVVILPLQYVPEVVERVVQLTPRNALVVHGSSVETLVTSDTITVANQKEITLCHCHFHFRPEAPLRRTLFGHNITAVFFGHNSREWERWLKNQFGRFGPKWIVLPVGEHDEVTEESQLNHMISAVVMGALRGNSTGEGFLRALDIGGPPFRFFTGSTIRTAGAPGVAESILRNHPHTTRVIDRWVEVLRSLRKAIEDGAAESIISTISATRRAIPEDVLAEWDRRIGQTIRMEADRAACNVELNFKPEENVPGLLLRVQEEIAKRSIDQTTLLAQTNPDGGCTFLIGVREMTPAVREMVAEVKSWRT